MAPKKRGKSELSVKHAHTATNVAPNWPAFVPLAPEADLALQEVLPGQIVIVPNFWTATLCKS
jgi:hypothetical protein